VLIAAACGPFSNPRAVLLEDIPQVALGAFGAFGGSTVHGGRDCISIRLETDICLGRSPHDYGWMPTRRAIRTADCLHSFYIPTRHRLTPRTRLMLLAARGFARSSFARSSVLVILSFACGPWGHSLYSQENFHSHRHLQRMVERENPSRYCYTSLSALNWSQCRTSAEMFRGQQSLLQLPGLLLPEIEFE
jgi:hypothetical protein